MILKRNNASHMHEQERKIKLADLVAEAELAQQLDLKPKTIKNRIAMGLFPLPVRLPGSAKNYFLRSEIDEWLCKSVVRRPDIGCSSRRGRKTLALLKAEREMGMRRTQ